MSIDEEITRLYAAEIRRVGPRQGMDFATMEKQYEGTTDNDYLSS